ncbi:D-alanyl-D-alanine carboxypeptidase [Clostridium sp. MCC353]|uniref:serine hydrolase n=1 Tax=Clostridium sp. MCC353 TaxID=2592646 RepID=UPI001C0289AC|nr:D-alanyl-D-alanine carboxypeptidase family protein [Clostridium sp. MCC353]MBT9774990.1 D-alanyl-D-alanine carboxypeptidase [Clostridium sp. MCC353]
MKKWKSFLIICMSFTLICNSAAYADEPAVTEPVVAAEGAVLLNAGTGEVLFEKNGNTRFYPASITKLMTALLTLENCGLTDTVTFSSTATTNMEAGSVSLKITEGDKLSVKDCLYGLLLKSANEIGNGLAEHIAGSNKNFADMMNSRAKALGCTNTNFANPHGLNNSNHYTTPYDMALIAREAFKNPTLCQITTTTTYKFPATKLAGERTISMGHKMVYESDSRYYPGIVGGKTGYTSLAGNTLVTCVEQNGVRLIVVIMKSKSTHYADTKALLEYGFAKVKTGTAGQPGVNQPGTSQSGSNQPGTSQSGSNQPGSNQPGTSQSGSNQPGTSQPGSNQPGTSQSGSGQPGSDQSGSSVSITSNGPGQTITTAQSPSAPGQQPETGQSEIKIGWQQDHTGWYYIKEDGSKAANEWLTLENITYWFDSNQYMATGWRQYNNGAWYYFKPSGAMASSYWQKDGDLWFYLGADGVMMKNTVTPDGYHLDDRGVWIQ